MVEVRELIRTRALELLRTSFDGGAAASENAPVRRRAVPKRAARSRAPREQAERSPAVAAKMAELVLVYVDLHPGTHLAGLRSGLGLSSDELRLPLGSLVEQGELRTSGRRRGTRYFLASGAPAGGGSRGRPARRRKPEPADPLPQDAPAIPERPSEGPSNQAEPTLLPAELPEPLSAAEPELAIASA